MKETDLAFPSKQMRTFRAALQPSYVARSHSPPADVDRTFRDVEFIWVYERNWGRVAEDPSFLRFV